MRDGFIKVAAGTPDIRVADCNFNANSAVSLVDKANSAGAKLLCLPELCLTGYTCGDLFFQDSLLWAAEAALELCLRLTAETKLLFALGLPVQLDGRLHNCAAVCFRGKLLGLVPKTAVANYGEFQDSRWFSGGEKPCREINFAGRTAPFGTNLLFPCPAMPGLCVGVEICEDLWVSAPPSTALAANGATVILNLSANCELAAKSSYRRDLVRIQSAKLLCGYIYANAGEGESTTDLVFSGHSFIAENGAILAEKRFENGLILSELDINHLVFSRRRINSEASDTVKDFCPIPFELEEKETKLTRDIPKLPFVPEDEELRAKRCEEIITIAAFGLKKRIQHTGAKKLVLGISGGLDSTLAMLISVKAMSLLGMPGEDLIAVTMPGFGTSRRTRANAESLVSQLGAKLRTVSIDAAVRQHFADIGHDENDRNVVYENAQARERTQVLMDIANGCDGLVIGTGDMSELALGWATYNGDHMSMYGVNAGIPKTLVRHLVSYYAQTTDNAGLSAILKDVLATPVSPELLPAQQGDISQKTEELVGPYELHDFFLYHLIRWGSRPKKVLRMAEYAFAGEYDRETIRSWEKVFIKRFFAQQFKRSCLPDGPKVGTLSLSPRGDWRMPSDAVCSEWLKELE